MIRDDRLKNFILSKTFIITFVIALILCATQLTTPIKVINILSLGLCAFILSMLVTLIINFFTRKKKIN